MSEVKIEDMTLEELLAGLKKRERDFIFALRKNGKQGDAAREAGFAEKSADVQATRLMKRSDIQRALQLLYEQDCKALCISSESIIVKASEMYNKCMQHEPVMEFNRETGEYVETGEYTFDSKGAAKALELIVKVAGLDKKQVELTGEPFKLDITVVE